MRARRRFHSLMVGLTVLTAIAASSPLPAAAFSVANGTILTSVCDSAVHWYGEGPFTDAANGYLFQSTGTVKWCFYAYRIADSDPYGDYYLVYAKADWATTYNASYMGDNYGSIVISSDVATKDGVHETDPASDVKLNTCTNVPFVVSVAYDLFSVSTSEFGFCRNGVLDVVTDTSTGGKFAFPDVTKTAHVEVSWMQKVANGAKPLYMATLAYPHYSLYRDPTTHYWKWTRDWSYITNSWRVR